ncbi:alpha-L-arabinofuranosidase C-terminal domain-containing protein [Rufibacter sediminis]|uniref:non-reducing end alpha-L-arabinofuranosidase n=1 Tax=Rufibacter sediminis TaxID=2762756 RepID=A0ABR6VN33_9BACT|nr:alpha-L-arabinofuranosidase C-terminal domain-containing protein [Rufibacter sediminis]MBC3538558.1 alpha-L-arabinofuranosidase [Rufibacter sediminis]
MGKKIILSGFIWGILSQATVAGAATVLNEPDSVNLLSYGTAKNNSHNGLHFAWSRDKKNWSSIGNEFSYLKSDYGRWGSEKRMMTPVVFRGPDGQWQCVWGLNEREKLFAHASSKDLVYWGRQSYPEVKKGTNVLRPVVQYDAKSAQYTITYTDAAGKYYRVTTKEFKTYSPVTEVSAAEYKSANQTVALPGGEVAGQVHRVAWPEVDQLIKTYELKQYKSSQYGETTAQDAQRFAGLKPVEAKISLQAANSKPISDLLVGVFFEDLNYAADGGLYAELIQNRDFEYDPSDKEGHDKNWTSTHSWSLKGDNTTLAIETAAPVHPNNPHYAVLDTKVPGAALANTGFDGIAVKKGERYTFSLFTKQLQGKAGKLQVRLVSDKLGVLAQTTVNTSAKGWKTATAVLTPSAQAADARLEVQPLSAGRVALDMFSLFPQKTFKGRKNGLRADLAQTIADLHPRFVRFPGGCVAHGDGLGNIYHWKNTIGPLEARKPQRNLWGYHQTAGLGYFEYFQFCEDVGAIPVPVVAAGVPCQNSGVGGGGQQGGIPMSEMGAYVQDILDLVEYANGSVHTKWGKKRAEAGHPEPFNLKYIGVGNEDLITDVFEERFTMIYKALQDKHPEITVIGTVGPFSEGTDYVEGWQIASKLNIPIVDEHYYQPPGWFIHNQDYYDRYDRSKSKVYLGEYAAHLPGRPNNLETALAEALYLTSVERNGDIVSMASYAPLLAKEGHTQWNPDLIYFNNTEVKPTVGYEVQKLFGQNAGTDYLPSTVQLSNNQEAVRKRIAVSVVRDVKSKDLIVKMVNLLPVPVATSLDLAGFNMAGAKAVKTVLQGNPTDKNLKPSATTLTLADSTNTELPAYSCTVLRIKNKSSK